MDVKTYKKSILFEILDEKGNQVEAFTLPIPPETFEIEEAQRLTETKTFGGLFVDDYGPDIYNILISGNTGGSVIRPSYDSKQGEFGDFDGKAAFYAFRNSIVRYKENYPDDFDKYTCRLFDLSTLGPADLEGKRIENVAEGYEINFRRFKMQRSKEKPLWYHYHLELTGVRQIGTYTASTTKPIKMDEPFNLVESVRRGVGLVQSGLQTITSIKNQIDSIIEFSTQLSAQMLSFVNDTVGIIQYPNAIIKEMTGAVKTFISNYDSAFSTLTQVMSKKTYYTTLQSLRELQSSLHSLVIIGKSKPRIGMVMQVLTLASRSETTVLRNFNEQAAVLISEVNELGFPKSSEKIVVYGYTTLKTESGMSLRDISIQYFGTPNYYEVIAKLNSIKTDDDLVIGQYLKIPVFSIGSKATDNCVYSENGDVLGVDIRVDMMSGAVQSTASGDFATQEGEENIVQAMNLRLNEELGSRLHLNLYGIRAAIGKPASNASILGYGLATVRDTIMQDPRMSSVRNMMMYGQGDAIKLAFDLYTIKNREVIPFKGEI